MKDESRTCDQPVNGKPCGRPAKWRLVLETVLGANDNEKTFRSTWNTCGNHDYDLQVSVHLKDLMHEE